MTAKLDPRSATVDDAVLGRRIRATRIAARMSQTALARACGISFQQIQKYERGTNRLTVARLAQIARCLDQPIEHFVDGISIQGHRTIADDLLQTARGRRLAQAWLRIASPRVRDRAVEMVEALAAARLRA